MVIGDSMTYGVGVNNDETYSSYLSEAFDKKINVYNISCPSWSFAEYYIAYSQYSKEIMPNLVIIGVFPCNDFSELSKSSWKGKYKGTMPNPPIRRADIFIDEAGNARVNTITYKFPILRESSLFVLGVKIYDKISFGLLRLKDIINRSDSKVISEEIVQEIAKKNKLLIVLIPSKKSFNSDKSERDMIIKYKHKLKGIGGVYILDLYPIMNKYVRKEDIFLDQIHFNKYGNKIIANAIYDYIENKGLCKSTE